MQDGETRGLEAQAKARTERAEQLESQARQEMEAGLRGWML